MYQDSYGEPSTTGQNQCYVYKTISNHTEIGVKANIKQCISHIKVQHNTAQIHKKKNNFNSQDEEHPSQREGDNEDNLNKSPFCFHCHQYGHFQWECGVRMDHSRKYLK